MNKNIVAIVGRPNVGKSSLFNKLIGRRVSIVHDQDGVTRDRLYHTVNWLNNQFEIIDTGGITIKGKPLQKQIQLQTEIAIKESTVIMLVVNGQQRLTPDDHFIISILRKSEKRVIILANKLEGNKNPDSSFYTTGFDIFSISALHGDGIADVLDNIYEYLYFPDTKEKTKKNLAIIGKPNAGKSSLLNSLSQKERSIVSSVAGTTRDSIKTNITINKRKFHIIDTAGISKKSKLTESVDHYALSRVMFSISESNLTLLVIDATKELSHFDARLAGYASEKMKPIIIVVNKWDLIKKNTNTIHNFKKMLRKEFKFLSWAPIVFISAINSEKLDKLKSIIIKVDNVLTKKIKTSLLNEMIIDIQIMRPAPIKNGNRFTISFIKQVEASIPTFVLFVNKKEYAHFSYLRYIEKQFRKYFELEGTPIKFIIKNKKGDWNE